MRARLAARPQDWRYASTRGHLRGTDDPLPAAALLLEREGDFAELLAGGERLEASEALRARDDQAVAGNGGLVAGLERMLGHPLATRKSGRKPMARGA